MQSSCINRHASVISLFHLPGRKEMEAAVVNKNSFLDHVDPCAEEFGGQWPSCALSIVAQLLVSAKLVATSRAAGIRLT